MLVQEIHLYFYFSQAVDASPALPGVQLDAEELQDILRDQDPAEDRAGHGDEEERVDHEVEAALVEQFFKELAGNLDQPLI